MRFLLIKLHPPKYITTSMRRIGNYYFSTTDYIPSTTLRGSILASYLYSTGKLDEDFYVSPAYPLKSAPSHYFITKEESGDKLSEERGVLETKTKEINSNLEEALKVGGKPKIGALLRLDSKDERKFNYIRLNSGKSVIQMHVAINKSTGASQKGMLFAYEYKEVENMWALASADSEVLDEVKTIYVGRGKNRGGKGIVVEKVKEIELELNRGRLAYCLSQCVPKIFGKELFAPSVIIGDLSVYTGWFTNDKFSGNKPVFRTLKEGSLVMVKEINENNQKVLRAGLNFMFTPSDLGSLLEKVGT